MYALRHEKLRSAIIIVGKSIFFYGKTCFYLLKHKASCPQVTVAEATLFIIFHYLNTSGFRCLVMLGRPQLPRVLLS